MAKERVAQSDPDAPRKTALGINDLKDWIGYERIPGSKTGSFVGFRVAFWDIETTGLNGRVHRLVCSSVADSFGRVTTKTRREKQYYGEDSRDDSKLALAIREELETYDIIIGWNSSGFDFPFLNARLMVAGYRPPRGDILHKDIMWQYSGQSRWSARYGSRALKCVQAAFKTPHSKVELDWDMWERMRAGDGKAEDLIVAHNIADVMVTRDVFAHTKPLILNLHR